MLIGPNSQVVQSWVGNHGREYSIRTCEDPTGFFVQVTNADGEVSAMSDAYKTLYGAQRRAVRMDKA